MPPAPAHCPGSDRTPNAPAGSPVAQESPTWAGYVIYRKTPSVTCVEGTWIQPKVSCPATGRLAVDIWIGMDGINSPAVGVNSSKTLEQIGTQAECRAGRARNIAWHEVLPAETNSIAIASMPVSAGDRIWAMVSYAGGAFTLRIRDLTKGGSFSITQSVPGAPRLTAEWIVEAPSTGCPSKCTISGLPRFGTVSFTGAYVTTGAQRGSISDDSWRDGVLDMVRSGIERAATSALTSAGTAFKVTWRHR